jgi:hypothetical protein
MNTKNTKKSYPRVIVRALLLAVLLILGLWLSLVLSLDYGTTKHKASAERSDLKRVYSTLSTYRETHGRWPATIEEAARQPGMPIVYWQDMFGQPWLYYPNAKPGTKEVLAATPDVIRMDWLPFVGWQDAVLADGTFVDFRSSPQIPK